MPYKTWYDAHYLATVFLLQYSRNRAYSQPARLTMDATKKTYSIPAAFAANAHINAEQYQALYQRSINDPDGFWGEQAKKFIDWSQPWQTVKSGGFEKLDMRWFVGGKLNACYNCIDRHLPTRANKTAIIWEGDDSSRSLHLTYAQLHEKICRLANALKQLGVKKGDRVCIYLPMIPEAVISMLACARIGAVHSVVFGGFSPESLKVRILDADCHVVITADEGIRGDKTVPLKKNTDVALAHCPNVKHVIVVQRTSVGNAVQFCQPGRDHWYHEITVQQATDCACEEMDAEDPLFILYTSGSTGSPKGILHTTGGYMVYAAMTHKYVFDYHESDIYWCTADVGWVTGHSYLVYGPLANGATSVMYEGLLHHPDFSRCWQIVDKHRVNIFYTAPTAIRALRREGDSWVTRTSRRSLKLLASVGEPINPDVWQWYHDVVGEGRCPVIDTWWQTETGGILITPLPGVNALKPGSAMQPFFGIVPAILDDAGNSVAANTLGKLVITQPWPGMMRGIYGDQQRFIDTYFKTYSGKYLTGDGAYYDADQHYWISGRNDDVIKVSGHRLGTEELESALVGHHAVAEAGVVAISDEITGEAIYAFVVTKSGVVATDALKQQLIQHVADTISPIAKPRIIQWAAALPKTRSGKIMRRILRKIARDELESIGDTSTLAEPGVVETLIAGRSS